MDNKISPRTAQFLSQKSIKEMVDNAQILGQVTDFSAAAEGEPGESLTRKQQSLRKKTEKCMASDAPAVKTKTLSKAYRKLKSERKATPRKKAPVATV